MPQATQPKIIPPESPPVSDAPPGENCLSCKYGITGRSGGLECHHDSPTQAYWPMVKDTEWCGQWATK